MLARQAPGGGSAVSAIWRALVIATAYFLADTLLNKFALGDGWAIFSQDGTPAAHFEFTVAITAEGPKILTPWHLSAAQRTAEPVPQGAAGAG